MREETVEQPAPLRSGYTTGSCANATSLAAARLLLTGRADAMSEIVLPKGQRVTMRLVYCRRASADPADGTAEAGTKDAGDDPDVTHGAVVYARVTLAVGEPAINPVPRRMMTEHLLQLAADHGYAGGFEVAIGVEGGAALALKTMNPRLGIVGGLSILGTTGIVRPPLLNFEWVDFSGSRAGEARRSEPLMRRNLRARLRARARQSLAPPGPRARPAARTSPPWGGARAGRYHFAT